MKAKLMAICLLVAGCAKEEASEHEYRYLVTCHDCTVGYWDPSTGARFTSDTVPQFELSGTAMDGQTLRLESYPVHVSDTAALVIIYVDGKQVEMDWAQPPNYARTHYYVR